MEIEADRGLVPSIVLPGSCRGSSARSGWSTSYPGSPRPRTGGGAGTGAGAGPQVKTRVPANYPKFFSALGGYLGEGLSRCFSPRFFWSHKMRIDLIYISCRSFPFLRPRVSKRSPPGLKINAAGSLKAPLVKGVFQNLNSTFPIVALTKSRTPPTGNIL